MKTLLFLFLAWPLAAQEVAREELAVIGWSKACSVALTHYGYPRLGDAVQSEPVQTRIGAMTIPPGEQLSRLEWAAGWDGAETWNGPKAKKTIAGLIAGGYDARGLVETVRPEGDAILRSSAAFSLRPSVVWPGADWRLARVHYAPLDGCALFVFAREGFSQPFYRVLLARLYNPRARVGRARKHAELARATLAAGDVDGGLAEAQIAAETAPDDAEARYAHAALLCLSGSQDQALTELGEAVKRDPKLKARAAKDVDFETLAEDRRFRDLVR